MTEPGYPDDWSPDDQARYGRYQAEKARRNARAIGNDQEPEPIRDPGAWRTASRRFQAMRADGDAFRDAAFAELGLDEATWRTERQEATPFGPRRYDIGRTKQGKDSLPHERVGYEFKLGGGDTELTLTQLDKDEFNLGQGWDLTWICNDLSRLSKPVQDRLTDLQEDYPDRFSCYDLEAIRAQGTDFQPQNERDRQAQRLANMQFTPPSQTQQPAAARGATADARTVPPELAQVAELAAASQGRSASSALRPRSSDPGTEAIRTAAHQAARKRSQTHGTATVGAAINSQSLSRPAAHRPGRSGQAHREG
jgi:hypothetical protein